MNKGFWLGVVAGVLTLGNGAGVLYQWQAQQALTVTQATLHQEKTALQQATADLTKAKADFDRERATREAQLAATREQLTASSTALRQANQQQLADARLLREREAAAAKRQETLAQEAAKLHAEEMRQAEQLAQQKTQLKAQQEANAQQKAQRVQQRQEELAQYRNALWIADIKINELNREIRDLKDQLKHAQAQNGKR